MEKWLSELSDRKDIAIALYARFPTEMAYGNHVIQIAKAFSKNNCTVNIYYPKTYNSKTLKETPEEYYGQIRNVNYVMIDNRDITSYKIYNLLPSIFKKLLFSLSTFMWARKLKNNQSHHSSFFWKIFFHWLITIILYKFLSQLLNHEEFYN